MSTSPDASANDPMRPLKSPGSSAPAPRTSAAIHRSDAASGAGDCGTLDPGSGLSAPSSLSPCAGSLVVDGDLTLAQVPGEDESLSVTHGLVPGLGPVSGLQIRGSLILGHTPSPESPSACGFLTVAGRTRGSVPPALVVDGAIKSPPRASMLFVLRGAVSAGMIVLWSGHLLGDGVISLHPGSFPGWPRSTARPTDRGTASGRRLSHAIGAFLGPSLVVEPFGSDPVPPSNSNARLPRAPEYGALDFDMGVVLQRSNVRLRIGPRDEQGETSDRLVARGALHLGGSRLFVSSAFLDVPSQLQPGEAFTLIEAGSMHGEFRSVDLPTPPRGLRFELARSGTRISLLVRAA